MTIVLDASVVVESITDGALAGDIRSDSAGQEKPFAVPHLLDIEAVSAIRRLTAGQRDGTDAAAMLSQLAALPVKRYAHTQLVGRIWELRWNFPAYDAAYIALAEALDAVLYTCDGSLRRGHRARVRVFEAYRPN